jgi:tetratricopeptide (TPR) repeat protein
VDEHPTVEDFARFLQQSARTSHAERNALVVRHLLSDCAVCRGTLQEVRGARGLLCRLLDIPREKDEIEAHSAYNYDWVFARAERAFNSMIKNGPPPELLPKNLAELAGLSEGEQIRRVSVEDCFARPEFIHCLIERSHGARYRSMRKTLHLARLAQVAAEACTSEVAGGDEELSDLRVQAWGQYGNALRISGRPREAEEAFSTARRYQEAGTGDSRLRAWLLEKNIPLAIFQNRFEDAIQMCEQAGRIYLELGEKHLLASTMVQKATAALYSGEAESAASILNQAIPLIDSEEDPLLLLVAHHNLARCCIDLDCPEEALALHYTARSLYREFKDPLILLRATWQEGMLLREVGHLHNAEAALLRAREGFMEQGLAYESALVCLDLADVYSRLGEAFKLQQVIAEATPIFRAMRLGPEMLASLLRLQQGIDSPASLGG